MSFGKMKKGFFVALLGCLFLSGYGFHIVGGFMSYRYVSGTTYQIRLTVYRDCNSTTPFDGTDPLTVAPALVGVYADGDPNALVILDMGAPVITRINPPIDNPCLTNTSGVCVEQGTYILNYTFPSGTTGYTLTHVRCCRNSSISNLFDPDNQGATFTARIPATNTFHNTSPSFTRFPPIFICLNAPLRFDHSATDNDGDQLVYSLCSPLQGADNLIPAPSPPPGPPFTDLNWAAGFSGANPMGGNSLKIDPNTGWLSGVPNTVGQFVVGVCVSEYRNGVLIGSYTRDFQFNVTECKIPIANIPSTEINPASGIGLYELNCENYTVSFRNNSYNPPPTGTPLGFNWDFGVRGISTDTSTAALPTYTYPDTGTFLVRLVANKSNGIQPCTDTTYAFVKIYPTFRSDFMAANRCQDSAAHFTDASVSTWGTVNQWNWSFGDGNSSSQKNPAHSYSAPGTYAVTLMSENTAGCHDTLAKNIIIYPVPVANFSFGTTCVNSPVMFTNSSTGNNLGYNWNFGNGLTSNQQNPSPIYSASGNYSVRLALASSDGCRDTATQSLTIHPLPAVTLNSDTQICPFTSVQLLASGGTSYVWTPTAGLSNPNISNPIATPSPPAPVVYTLRITDAFQCSNTGMVRISFHPIPNIDAGLDTSVCLNPGSFRDSVLLRATGGVNYQWSPTTGLSNPNISNPVSRPTTNTTYYLTGTDVNGCSLTDSVAVYFLDPSLELIIDTSIGFCVGDTARPRILNQGASLYLWNPIQYLTHPTSFNTGFFPPDTLQYVLTVSNYCYTKSDSLSVIVWPLPVLGLNPLDSVCIGDSIQLNVSGAKTYQWNSEPTLSDLQIPNPVANPVSTTQYTVTGTSINGCIKHDSTTILVYLPSVIRLAPQVSFVCEGNPVQLSATGAASYVWSPASSLDSSTSANPIASPADTTWYFVKATNVHGCTSNDSLLLRVQHPVTANTASPFNACVGVPLQLAASGGFYYEWFPSKGLNDAFSNHPFVLADSTTNYIVRVSNDCFSDTAVAEVILHPLPEVDAGPDTLIWRDTDAMLEGATNESNHFWHPSDWLNRPFELNTNATPPRTIWYELFAVDEFGCVGKDSVLITVEPHTILLVPTGFSPDGSGVNDVFHIVRWLNIERLKEFSVYNRWGERVFSTKDISQGWDGSFRGRPQPIGVYAWSIIAQTRDGEEIMRKGNVTLLR
ncbi:MAG: PKD domain-containing protein [Bacteroidetes bacterium]|nr:PKD domain-containing protein [Bacteroidota bacterium]